MTGLLGVLVSTAGPLAAMWLVLWRTRARALGPVVCVCAAWGLGTGVSSLLWWVLGRIPDASATTLTYLDTGIWAAAVAGLATRRPRTEKVARPPSQGRATLALAVLLVIGGIAAVTFAARSFVTPHGDWDAWAIWNARARALFFSVPAPGAHTMPLAVLAHPDYPELLPRSIARAWTFAGVDAVSVPVALAAMFGAFVALVAGASLRHRRTASLGLLTAAFILASPAFVTWTWSQSADVPLSFYFLLTFIFAASARMTNDAPLWALAGLSAGLAAWTKNEGIAFFLVVALVAAIRTWRAGWASLAAFAAGAAPALAVLIAFKLSVPRPNYLMAAQSWDRVGGLLNWDRISMIGEAMGRELWLGGATVVGPLPLLAVFVVVNRGVRFVPEARFTLQALALMLAAYGCVYLLTPYDLTWHLRSSVDRVILQLMPSMVWAAMLLAQPPDG